jgi:hypothetical protein
MTFDEIDGHQAIDFARSVFKFVDDQVVALERLIKKDMAQEGDSGLFGYADYFAGIGFVAGQRYITSVRGFLKISKSKAFAIGPDCVSGVSYAQLINAAANYWKHSDEWNFDDLTKQQQATRDVIKKVGVTVDANKPVAYNVFHQVGLRGFKKLLPVLSKWSDGMSDSLG